MQGGILLILVCHNVPDTDYIRLRNRLLNDTDFNVKFISGPAIKALKNRLLNDTDFKMKFISDVIKAQKNRLLNDTDFKIKFITDPVIKAHLLADSKVRQVLLTDPSVGNLIRKVIRKQQECDEWLKKFRSTVVELSKGIDVVKKCPEWLWEFDSNFKSSKHTITTPTSTDHTSHTELVSGTVRSYYKEKPVANFSKLSIPRGANELEKRSKIEEWFLNLGHHFSHRAEEITDEPEFLYQMFENLFNSMEIAKRCQDKKLYEYLSPENENETVADLTTYLQFFREKDVNTSKLNSSPGKVIDELGNKIIRSLCNEKRIRDLIISTLI